jgi:hypothetical protein
MPRIATLVLVGALLICSASVCTKNSASNDAQELAQSFSVDAKVLKADIAFIAQSPHPMGSSRQDAVGQYLQKRARENGASKVETQNFEVDTPNPAALEDATGPREHTIKKSGRNILAQLTGGDQKCWLLFGSHYDSKEIPGIAYHGANDSGSSSALLLQMIKHLSSVASFSGCDILFIWFDGEEAILSEWNTGETIHPAKIQDNTYGSRHFVNELEKCGSAHCYQDRPIKALILLDMIGMPGLMISLDSNSAPALQQTMIQAASNLGFSNHIATQSKGIEDDHIPFMKAGIPSLNMIDFENLDVWHRSGDEPDIISPESIEIAGKIAILTAIRTQISIKDP